MAPLIFSNNKIKKPFRPRENILAIHSPKSYLIETANTISIDTGITINLPERSTGYLATKFKGQNIETIEGPKTQRLWLTLLNESYFDKYIIRKGEIIGYLVLKSSDLKIKYEKKQQSKIKTRRLPNNYLSQKWDQNWKMFWQKKKKETNGRLFK